MFSSYFFQSHHFLVGWKGSKIFLLHPEPLHVKQKPSIFESSTWALPGSSTPGGDHTGLRLKAAGGDG